MANDQIYPLHPSPNDHNIISLSWTAWDRSSRCEHHNLHKSYACSLYSFEYPIYISDTALFLISLVVRLQSSSWPTTAGRYSRNALLLHISGTRPDHRHHSWALSHCWGLKDPRCSNRTCREHMTYSLGSSPWTAWTSNRRACWTTTREAMSWNRWRLWVPFSQDIFRWDSRESIQEMWRSFLHTQLRSASKRHSCSWWTYRGFSGHLRRFDTPPFHSWTAPAKNFSLFRRHLK